MMSLILTIAMAPASQISNIQICQWPNKCVETPAITICEWPRKCAEIAPITPKA
jgi:hypothetical protein